MENNDEEGGYYRDSNGIKHCTRCGEALERVLPEPLLGMFDRVPNPCKCMLEEWDKEEQEQKQREHQQAVRRLRMNCFHEQRMYEWNFDNDDGSVPAMKKARDYVEHWDEVRSKHIGLLLWGDVGTGKSYTAAAIANALIDMEKSVYMTDFAEISNISAFDSDEYISCLIKNDLLIIDDLGAERSSEFAMQNVFNVINRRWETGKPLIVTTNMTLDQINEAGEEDVVKRRIYDRILDMCKPILVSGPSKRKEGNQQKMDCLKGIFNGQ